MEISSQNSTSFKDDEGYSALYEKVLIALGQTLTFAASALLNGGIILYEDRSPEMLRTLVSRMLAVSSAYNIFFLVVMYIIGLTYHAFGLRIGGEVFCVLIQFLMLSGMFLSFLGHNEVILLRYIYTYHLGKFGHVKENFLAAFFLAFNLVMTLFVCLCLTGLCVEDLLIYQKCIQPGYHENTEYVHGELIPTVLTILTLANHFTVNWKARRRQKNQIHPFHPGQQEPESSVLNFKAAVGLMVLSLLLSIAIIASSQFEFGEKLRTIPMLRGPFVLIVVLFVPFSIFANKSQVRHVVMRELKEMLKR